MPKKKSTRSRYQALPSELRVLVKISVACLGQVIERELGREAYQRIERVRQLMASLRGASESEQGMKAAASVLKKTYAILEKLSAEERLAFASSYTLMLELINACENAYRSFRLQETKNKIAGHVREMEAITFVLTAHPTEARTAQNIAIFHQIQNLLIQALNEGGRLDQERLTALLEIAWRAPIVRERKPSVEDEAHHIYSIVLRKENLDTLLAIGSSMVPVYLRSWVGGDKDGHPFVNEHTLVQSLSLSRWFLYRYARAQLDELSDLLNLFSSKDWQKKVAELKRMLAQTRKLRASDGKKIHQFRQSVHAFKVHYERELGASPLPLLRLRQLLHVFPGLVIPLELREDSGLLVKHFAQKNRKSMAVERMLETVERISHGGEARWYAQGFIVSMTEKLEHLEIAASLVRKACGAVTIPVVPLFEQKAALSGSVAFVEEFLKHSQFKKSIRTYWRNQVEIMLGYSDSSKEAGVLPSRLEVSGAMRKLDRVFEKRKVKAVYFHGSGGSVDRGGGPVEDQLASLSEGALKLYKATIQGEMVERNFASPEIVQSQLSKIAVTARHLLGTKRAPAPSRALSKFSGLVETQYRKMVSSPEFLSMVERVTPYPFLSMLTIGSRPSKRAVNLSLSTLRAIPWILCWTQTRVLFPTWWGIGSAWQQCSASERRSLKQDYSKNPVFRSYLHVLGFTLSKIELSVFQFYLEQSLLSKESKQRILGEFKRELKWAKDFFEFITGMRDPLWFRPWLGESIELRSSMIHPLNVLQILAQRTKDRKLLRVTVTGIASGMLTTG